MILPLVRFYLCEIDILFERPPLATFFHDNEVHDHPGGLFEGPADQHTNHAGPDQGGHGLYVGPFGHGKAWQQVSQQDAIRAIPLTSSWPQLSKLRKTGMWQSDPYNSYRMFVA